MERDLDEDRASVASTASSSDAGYEWVDQPDRVVNVPDTPRIQVNSSTEHSNARKLRFGAVDFFARLLTPFSHLPHRPTILRCRVSLQGHLPRLFPDFSHTSKLHLAFEQPDRPTLEVIGYYLHSQAHCPIEDQQLHNCKSAAASQRFPEPYHKHKTQTVVLAFIIH